MIIDSIKVQVEMFIKSTIDDYFRSSIENIHFEKAEKHPKDKERVSIIFSSGSVHRLSFAIFFDDKDAMTLANNVLGQKVSRVEGFDFIMEYCNLLMGAVKRTFDKQGMSSDISLPLIADPFNEQFFESESAVESELLYWDVQVGGVGIKIYFQMDVFDVERVKKFKVVGSNAIDEDIDFF